MERPSYRAESGDILLSVQLTLAREDAAREPAPAGVVVPLDRGAAEALARRRHPSGGADVGSASFVDPETGAGSVRALKRDLATEIGWSRGPGSQPSVVGLLVEPCGELRAAGRHEEATAVLRAVVEVVPFLVRARDRVYRIGRDDLALLMPATSDEGKEAALGRLLAKVPGAVAERKLGHVRLVPRRLGRQELDAVG